MTISYTFRQAAKRYGKTKYVEKCISARFYGMIGGQNEVS